MSNVTRVELYFRRIDLQRRWNEVISESGDMRVRWYQNQVISEWGDFRIRWCQWGDFRIRWCQSELISELDIRVRWFQNQVISERG